MNKQTAFLAGRIVRAACDHILSFAQLGLKTHWFSTRDCLPECSYECLTNGACISNTVLIFGKSSAETNSIGFGYLQDDAKWVCYENEHGQVNVVEVAFWASIPVSSSSCPMRLGITAPDEGETDARAFEAACLRAGVTLPFRWSKKSALYKVWKASQESIAEAAAVQCLRELTPHDHWLALKPVVAPTNDKAAYLPAELVIDRSEYSHG